MPDAIRQDAAGPWLAGIFEAEAPFLAACRAARAEGRSGLQAWSPWPVHGLDEALGLAPSPIGRVVLAAVLLGAALCFAMQYHLQVVDWPLVHGGKPYATWQLWVVPTLEAGLLLGALANLAACLHLCRLLPDPCTRLPAPRLADDRLCLAVALEGGERDRLEAWLRAQGAVEVLELAPGPALRGETEFAREEATRA
jgi:hypothetical protein